MAWTDRYVDASAAGGGTGTSPADPWTLAEAVSNTALGMRVNFKAGTYTNTANLYHNVTADATNPILWRGYKTTPGDLDGTFTGNLVDGTDIPLIDHQAGYLILDTAYHHLIGMSFKNSHTGAPAFYDRRGFSFTKNCRFTMGAVVGYAIDTNVGFDSFLNCEFVSEVTPTIAILEGIAPSSYTRCLFKGDGTGTGVNLQGHGHFFNQCVFYNLNAGINSTNDRPDVHNCTFVDIADDAIYNSVINQGSSFIGNYFYNVGGYCFGNGSTNGNGIQIMSGNAYYNSPNRIEGGGNVGEYDDIADSSDPFEDYAAGDFTLKSTSNAYNVGLGGFWSLPTTAYGDSGAVGHQDPSGGGGATVHPLYAN